MSGQHPLAKTALLCPASFFRLIVTSNDKTKAHLWHPCTLHLFLQQVICAGSAFLMRTSMTLPKCYSQGLCLGLMVRETSEPFLSHSFSQLCCHSLCALLLQAQNSHSPLLIGLPARHQLEARAFGQYLAYTIQFRTRILNIYLCQRSPRHSRNSPCASQGSA